MEICRRFEGTQARQRTFAFEPDRERFVGAGHRLSWEPGRGGKLARQALELDPLASAPQYNLARILWFEGKLDEADAAARKAAELQPESASTRRWQVFVAIKRGDSETALREAQFEPDDKLPPVRARACAHFARRSSGRRCGFGRTDRHEPRPGLIKSRRFTPCAERETKLSNGYKSRLITTTPACWDFWLIRC